MFDHVIQALSAREQVALLLGGIFMALLGGAFIADHVYWRLRAWSVPGTLVGARERASRTGRSRQCVYFPVVEYLDAAGERVVAETDAGSSSLSDKVPGRRVTLLVREGQPLLVRILGRTGLVFGAIFIAIGCVLGTIAMTAYDITAWTFVIGVAALAAISAVVLRLATKRKSSRPGNPDPDRNHVDHVREMQALPLLRMDSIRPRLRKMDTTAAKIAPFMTLVGLALIGIGSWQAWSLYELATTGETTTGRVVGHERVYRANDRMAVYYPRVRFETADGRIVEFRDRVGSGGSVVVRSSGAEVKVLYDPANPQRARVDREIWNWALPFGLVAAGLLFFTVSVLSRRRSRLT